MSSSSSSSSSTLDVVTYNLLSDSLCSPDWFIECTEEACDSENRLTLIKAKLEIAIENHAIICLQELSRHWAGLLYPFFAAKNYTLIASHYGYAGNGYMGVAIAYPTDHYSLQHSDIQRIGESVSFPKAPRHNSRLKSFLVDFVYQKLFIQYFISFLLFLVGFWPVSLGRYTIDTKIWHWAYYCPWKSSVRRSNTMVSLGLKSKATDQTLAVSTYHMPCAFKNPDIMIIHASLATQHAQYLWKNWFCDALILTGDWNFIPDSAPYNLITSGSLSPAHPEYPVDIPNLQNAREDFTWRLAPLPHGALQSAYAQCDGREPDHTNFALTKRSGGVRFIETLDYIFVSDNVYVLKTLKTPHRDDLMSDQVPYPSATEPSDHLMIGASFQIKN